MAVSDPAVAYIAAGPPDARYRQRVEMNRPLILSWDRAIPFNQMRLTALAKTGKALFQYGYARKSDGAVTETYLGWHPVPSGS